MLKRDQTIVLVNVIGALLQILYVATYLHYTKQKVSMWTEDQLTLGVLFAHVSDRTFMCLFFVLEVGDVPDTCSRNGSDLWLVLLHHVSSSGRHSAQPARPHLQRNHRQHVPVAPNWLGMKHMHYRQHVKSQMYFSFFYSTYIPHLHLALTSYLYLDVNTVRKYCNQTMIWSVRTHLEAIRCNLYSVSTFTR